MNLIITDLEKRLLLLKSLALFANISATQLEKLANHFHDVSYASGSIIIKENEIIDSLFIIVDGRVEISRKNEQVGETEREILSVLHPGEVIGLNDTGYFSPHSLRTATATALTQLLVIRMELSDFKQFLQANSDNLPNIAQLTDTMLLHAFIKKMEPFANVDHTLLEQIIPHIEEINVPAETVIFSQDDIAESCYLLCTGKAEVILTKANADKECIAELEAGELFGEMALITNSKRNATVKTMTQCKLLVLKQNEFLHLVNQSSSTSSILTSMLMDRHRPKQCENITIHFRKDTEQNTLVILRNLTEGKYIKTSEEGLFVWNMLDGEHTLQDIAVAYFYQYHKLATETIGNLVLLLMQSGFVVAPVLANYVVQPSLPFWIRVLSKIRSIAEYEYSLKNVDASIARFYEQVGYLFFTRIAKILMAFFAIVGFGAFIGFLNHAGEILKTTSHAWLLIVMMGPANIFTIPVHELAHALTTKAYGYKVYRLGVGWFWLGPMAFADTSDMWLSSRGPRMAVNLAGIYINTVISGILGMLVWFIPDPTLAVFIWLVALSGYLIAFYNLDPMFELDGYYVLMDAMDKPNLRTYAIKWLIQDSKKTFCNPKLARQYMPEILYWITSISFIFISAIVAYIMQKFVFNNILPEKIAHVHHSHFSWILSLLVILLSFASLYGKVKQQAFLLRK
jgi:putative peptide zinc metalloprotease protein